MLTVSEERLLELLDDGIEVDSRDWRHGRQAVFVVHVDGSPYLTGWIDIHHDEGIQVWSEGHLRPAKQIEVTVKRWVEAEVK